MGRRWRRNNNNNKKQQQQQQKQQDVERRQQDQWRDEDAADDENGGDAPGGGGDTNPSTTQAFWNQEEDRDDLLRYLESYKRACIERHETFLVRKVTTTTDGSRQEGNHQVEHEVPATAATVIGGVIMPPLTTTTGGDGDGDAKELSHHQPFLVLPKCLSSKQRRMVHECCVEVDLFHRTFEEGGEGGDHANNRYVAISIYADAFDGGLPTMEKRDGSSPVPVYKYRPWYYSARRRKMEDENRRRREALDSIDALLDQPGECLRDGLDEVDFEAAVGDDLSDIDPPSAAAAATAAAAASPHEDSTAWTLVESKGAMLSCVAELQATKPTEMAFDLEAVNKSKHAQLTCLLQIAVPVKDPGGENKKQTKSATVKEYVIDTLAPGVWDEVPKLAPFFADPKIVKVGHSVGGLDVRCLHRDFGIYVVNVFDTYEASRALPLPCGFGLAKLCRHYNVQNSERYRDLKSKYQRCDWRVRPLSDEMIEYGRNDVHYLLKLRQLMIRDLTKYDLYLYDQTLKRQKLESEMVAESLAATLQHIQEAEGDDGSSFGGETFRTSGAETFKTTVQPAADTALTEEENGVPSLIKSRDLEEDFFFTPMTSYNSAVESISGDVPAGQEEGEGEEDNIVNVKEDEDENKITQQLEIPRRTLKASAAVLRMHPQLMTVLTRSQERCKGLWTDDSTEDSNPLKHPALTTLLKRSKKKVKRAGGGDISWSNVQTQLYLDLFEWRSSVASVLQCLPDFVAPVDFLVDVAWKRPTFVEAVRRVSFNLPVALEENAQFVEQMLLIVRRSVGKVPNSAGGRTKVYWYYSDREESDTLDLMEKDGGAGSSTRAVTVMKVALAASIVAAVAFIVLSPKSRSKLRPSCY